MYHVYHDTNSRKTRRQLFMILYDNHMIIIMILNHDILKFIMIFLKFIMIFCNLSWYFEIYHDIFKFIMIFLTLSWYLPVQWKYHDKIKKYHDNKHFSPLTKIYAELWTNLLTSVYIKISCEIKAAKNPIVTSTASRSHYTCTKINPSL